uniref:ABC transporter ATP-binding protein n=1 Tax=candidate division CPR3 bacterium TaxID=2268181 RepID=A0A7C4M0S0_UNCC3
MTKGIKIQKVFFSYIKNNPVLNNISLNIKAGTFLGITGVNGSGKSTFAYLLNGIIPHLLKGQLQGKVLIDGISTKTKNVAYFSKKVGIVFQNPDFSLFNLTVKEEIAFGLKNLSLNNQENRIKRALKNVGMTNFALRDPQTLSLGEKEKLSLASVLALDTQYIVLDEPTAQLDYKNSLDLYKILSRLNKEGKTIITIEHDTDFLWDYTYETIILDKGQIILYGPTKKILKNINLLKKLGIKTPKACVRK